MNQSINQSTAAAPLEIGMLIYPGMTALDMVAPQLVFANLMDVRVHLLWKTLAPVASDSGMAILPTCTLDDCPRDLDLLFVGGSKADTWPLLADAEVIDFLADRGTRAKWVTSVCTGSLLLGAAGLLDGYRATSHWAVRHLLAMTGAIPTDDRVVTDRNRITGGGVTAGMDFGLTIAAMLRGEHYAKTLQMLFEYDPQPPFQTGAPHSAEAEVLQTATQIYAAEIERAEASVRALQRHLVEREEAVK
ncbi:DJ-1/PfpI family protein [Paraherbaspirillum soli]|uniref:DJ-1/PfpI family protein n=1 Tax=Paraherbaspirillum soli TaxID=631222 RepID=A0ABW0M587_9BURK